MAAAGCGLGIAKLGPFSWWGAYDWVNFFRKLQTQLQLTRPPAKPAAPSHAGSHSSQDPPVVIMESDSDVQHDETLHDSEVETQEPQKDAKPGKSALKKPSATPAPVVQRPELPPQPDPKDLDVASLNPLTDYIIARQATINIGTIGHVAHGKSTVVKAISGVQTVRFKNELERNITIKLGYANAKIYKCDNKECPRPTCYRSYKSEKEVDPPCERDGCGGTYRLLRHVS